MYPPENMNLTHQKVGATGRGRNVVAAECAHDVYINGVCGNCATPLNLPQSSSVSMIHSIPGLKVTKEYAQELGKADQQRLIDMRKLVLLVDLDQTILHTTHERVENDPNVHSFTLWPNHPTYYTKLRPHLNEFLEEMSEIYELHIFTFGCRLYARKIASIIDPEHKYFGDRILSRDESVDQYSKRGNLNNLFPCGDAMVCIIDDRSDVWRGAGNLIQVKPYSYFKTSISDGAATANTSKEDEEALDRDVDKLEALLGLDEEESNDETEKKPDKKETKSETHDTNLEAKSNGEATANENDIDDEVSDLESDDSDVQAEAPALPEDNDQYLMFELPLVLRRIHEKWYTELDEQRRYLTEGENYKLPDIKDITSKYFRRH